MGGDEFVILCKGINSKDMQIKGNDIVAKISALGKEFDNSFDVSCSVGYVMVPQEGVKFEDLYNKADMAMFIAKGRGKNTCSQYVGK